MAEITLTPLSSDELSAFGQDQAEGGDIYEVLRTPPAVDATQPPTDGGTPTLSPASESDIAGLTGVSLTPLTDSEHTEATSKLGKAWAKLTSPVHPKVQEFSDYIGGRAEKLGFVNSKIKDTLRSGGVIPDAADETRKSILSTFTEQAVDNAFPSPQALRLAATTAIPVTWLDFGLMAPGGILGAAGKAFRYLDKYAALTKTERLMAATKTVEAALDITVPQKLEALASINADAKIPAKFIGGQLQERSDNIANMIVELEKSKDVLARVSIPEGTESAQKIMDEALAQMAKGEAIPWEKFPTVSDAVAQAIKEHRIDIDSLGGAFAKLDRSDPMIDQQAALLAKNIFSSSGKNLNFASQLSKKMDALVAKLPPDMQEAYKKANGLLDPMVDLWDKSVSVGRSANNMAKVLGTAGVSTVAGNLWSGAFRAGVQIPVDFIWMAMGGKVGMQKAVNLSAANMIHFWSNLWSTPSGVMAKNSEYLKLLEKKVPTLYDEVVGNTMSEMVLGSKFTNAVTFLPRWQNRIGQVAAFRTRLDQLAAIGKKTIDQLDYHDYYDAAQHALDLSYTKYPKEGIATVLPDVYRKLPFLMALGPKFPRFLANAIRYTYEFSPLSTVYEGANLAYKATQPGGLARAITSRRARDLQETFARSFVGTSLWGMGYAMEEAGVVSGNSFKVFTGRVDKKTGEKETFDLRRLGPAYTYPMFMGVTMNRIMKRGPDALLAISPNDLSAAVLSVKRSDFLGMPIIDAMSQKDLSSVEKVYTGFMRSVGDYFGMFTAPIKSIEDIYTGFESISDEWIHTTANTPIEKQPSAGRYVRSTKLNPLTGATLRNIPHYSRSLPLSPRMLSGLPNMTGSPFMRQLGPGTFGKETPAETEASRLGVTPLDAWPRSPSPEMAMLIAQRMGEYADTALTTVMQTEFYNGQRDGVRQALFKSVLGEAKKAGKGVAIDELMQTKQGPDMVLKDYTNNVDLIVKRFLEGEKESTESADAPVEE